MFTLKLVRQLSMLQDQEIALVLRKISNLLRKTNQVCPNIYSLKENGNLFNKQGNWQSNAENKKTKVKNIDL